MVCVKLPAAGFGGGVGALVPSADGRETLSDTAGPTEVRDKPTNHPSFPEMTQLAYLGVFPMGTAASNSDVECHNYNDGSPLVKQKA